MRTEFKPWLPASAFDRGVIDMLLDDAVRSWSAKWFVRPEPNATALRPVSSVAGLRTSSREALTLDADVALVFDSDVRDRLGRSMIGAPAEATAANEADLRVLEALGSDCLDDLARRLAEAFRLDGAASWRRCGYDEVRARMPASRSGMIAPRSDAPGIEFLVAEDLLIRFLRGGAGVARADDPLGSRDAALARQVVAVTAVVGRSRVSLGEVRELSEGDVIVLDRKLGDALDLVIEGTRRSIGRCTVEQAEGGFALRLTEAIEGDT